jgi:hypothetical protein
LHQKTLLRVKKEHLSLTGCHSVIATSRVNKVMPLELLASRIIGYVKNILDITVKPKACGLTDCDATPTKTLL